MVVELVVVDPAEPLAPLPFSPLSPPPELELEELDEISVVWADAMTVVLDVQASVKVV